MPTATDQLDFTEPLLTQAEAARYLGVSDRTVRAYIARGALRAVRVDGSRLVRIRRRDVESMLTPVSAGADSSDRFAAHVARLVESAPPLSAEQRDRLVALLRPAASQGALDEAS